MSDAKNFVTVKIEEPVRDDAREDSRTYTQIMRDGLEDSSSQEPEATEIDYEKLIEVLRTHSVDSTDIGEVLGRIDDLENSLPRKVAEEVRR